MLNELLTLERSLAAHGAAAIARHPDLSQLLKGDVVRVRLRGDGGIDCLQLLDGRTRGDVWTLRDGKHNGFPGLKTSGGLLVLSKAERGEHDAIWKAAAKNPAGKRQEIARLAAAFPPDPEGDAWPKPGHRRRIAERLVELRPLEADDMARSVPAVFERFLKTLDIEPPFLARLLKALLERARDGEAEWLDPVRSALVEGIALAIDVDDGFPRDAGDPRQIGAVSRAHSAGGASSAGRSAECALSGPSARLLEGSFPQPTLPSLGQTYLYTRNKDIPAMARYGRNGAGSLPIDADLAGQLSGALVAVTGQERHRKTWRLLPREAGKKAKADLLLAFVATDLNRNLAGPLGDQVGPEGEEDPDGDGPPGISDLEHAAQAMLDRFGAVRTATRSPDEARILVLRAVDPANRKAIYDCRTDVNRLFDRAEIWATKVMRNTPPWLSLRILVKKELRDGYALPQPPLGLTALTRKHYVRGGREAFEAPGLPVSEGLALFLGEGDPTPRGARDGAGRVPMADAPPRARRALRVLLDRHQSLIVGLAHANRRRELADFDKTGAARRDGLRSAAWMGALLWFAGRPKETYMDDTGFKLGQLLAAVDAVHLGYCIDMRGGQVPPTLVGNSVFATAGRNPDQALGVLAARWKPYDGWSKRAYGNLPEGEPAKGDARGWAVKRAASQVRLAGQLSAELRPRLAAMREQGRAPDDKFRAELLLGYLAGVKPEPKAADTAKPTGETTS